MNSSKFLPLVFLFFCLANSSFAQSDSTLVSKNVTLLGQKAYPGSTMFDLTGYVASDGTEYALMIYDENSTSGEQLAIIDVSNTDNMVEVANVEVGGWDVKVWEDYAYVVGFFGTDLTIVNLKDLPAANNVIHWNNEEELSGGFNNSFIDENGFIYLLGNPYGGVAIYDLKPNPENPSFVTFIEGNYMHDGFVRRDTLWVTEYNSGILRGFDVRDKSAPIQIGRTITPGATAHSCWVSEDNNVVYVTDEIVGGTITAYDVSDASDIKELGQTVSFRGEDTSPHNIYGFGNWLFASYYREGLVVFDITHPEKMVPVNFWDPHFTDNSNPILSGAFGIYPYLPSGNILVSDMQEGLFVFGVDYTRGTYVGGTVVDQDTGELLSDVDIEVVGQFDKGKSTVDGSYLLYMNELEDAQLSFKKEGYYDTLLSVSAIESGETAVLDVALQSLPSYTLTGIVEDNEGNRIANAILRFSNEWGVKEVYTDEDGAYEIPHFYWGSYDITVGGWGYDMVQQEGIEFEGEEKVFILHKGYYEDIYLLDYGWTVENDEALVSGAWERGVPNQKFGLDLETDVESDIGDECYKTGFGIASNLLTDGSTSLLSPEFDLSNYEKASLNYQFWFYNYEYGYLDYGKLEVYIQNGDEEILLETIQEKDFDRAEGDTAKWMQRTVNLEEHTSFSGNMRLRFKAGIKHVGTTISFDNILNVAIDEIQIKGEQFVGGIEPLEMTAPNVLVAPNPFEDHTLIRVKNKPVTEVYQVIIYDLLGKRIAEYDMIEEELIIKRNDLVKGVYVCEIKDKKSVIAVNKLIVN